MCVGTAPKRFYLLCLEASKPRPINNVDNTGDQITYGISGFDKNEHNITPFV